MFTSEWLKKTKKKYGTGDDIHMDNYQRLLDYLRATDDNTPKCMTAKLLKRLLTGEDVHEIIRILGIAGRYNDLLQMFNIYDNEAAQIKEKIAHPATTDAEKKELNHKWNVAWEKREAYWTSLQIVSVPLTQICLDIDGKKYMWYVDVDRID